MQKKNILTYLLFYITICTAHTAFADNTMLYNVEILIFTRQGHLEQESFNSFFYPDFKHTVELKPYINISDLTYTDSQIKYKELSYPKALLNRQGYQTIYHKKWTQPLTGAANFSVLLQGDSATNEKSPYINNYAKNKQPIPSIRLIYIELFKLYTSINLGPTQARYPFIKTLLNLNLNPTNNQSKELIGTFKASAGKLIDVTLDLNLKNTNTTIKVNSFKLIESRKINSNKLHYFDHPAFGVLLKITKQTEPE